MTMADACFIIAGALAASSWIVTARAQTFGNLLDAFWIGLAAGIFGIIAILSAIFGG